MVDGWIDKLLVAVKEAPAARQATSDVCQTGKLPNLLDALELKLNSQGSSTMDAIPFTTRCCRSNSCDA